MPKKIKYEMLLSKYIVLSSCVVCLLEWEDSKKILFPLEKCCPCKRPYNQEMTIQLRLNVFAELIKHEEEKVF